jgi:hypothetical protein
MTKQFPCVAFGFSGEEKITTVLKTQHFASQNQRCKMHCAFITELGDQKCS